MGFRHNTTSTTTCLKILQDINSVAKRRSDLTNTPLTQPMSNLDTLIQALTQHVGTQESTGKRITRAVGIDDLVVGELGNGESLGVRVRGGQVALAGMGRGGGRGDEGRVGALGDNDESGTGCVGFGKVGDGRGDLTDGRLLRGTVSYVRIKEL